MKHITKPLDYSYPEDFDVIADADSAVDTAATGLPWPRNAVPVGAGPHTLTGDIPGVTQTERRQKHTFGESEISIDWDALSEMRQNEIVAWLQDTIGPGPQFGRINAMIASAQEIEAQELPAATKPKP